MEDCVQMVGLTVLVVAVVAGMAIILTWEPKGAKTPDTCPFCVAVARSKPAVGHIWRCGGRYDRACYSVDWGAVNLDLFRGYHGHDPEGFMGDRETPPNEGRPKPPSDGYRKDRHE